MVTFFLEGGLAMFPTLLFGFLCVAAGVLNVLRPARGYLALSVATATATLLSGLLGTCLGVMSTFRYLQTVPAGEQFSIATMGIRESLNNLVLALIPLIVAALLPSIAAVRAAKRTADV